MKQSVSNRPHTRRNAPQLCGTAGSVHGSQLWREVKQAAGRDDGIWVEAFARRVERGDDLAVMVVTAWGDCCDHQRGELVERRAVCIRLRSLVGKRFFQQPLYVLLEFLI